MQVSSNSTRKNANMIRGNVFRACTLAKITQHAFCKKITGFSETSLGSKNHAFFDIYPFGAGCIAATTMPTIFRFRENCMEIVLYFP